MAKKSQQDIEICHKFMVATGLAIREWASLERQLITHLAHLLRSSHEKGRVIWATMPNIHGRILLLKRLAGLFLHEPARQEFIDLINRASKLGKKRNLLAHCARIDQVGKTFTFYSDADANGDFQLGKAERFTLTNIENWPSDIAAIKSALSDHHAMKQFREAISVTRIKPPHKA